MTAQHTNASFHATGSSSRRFRPGVSLLAAASLASLMLSAAPLAAQAQVNVPLSAQQAAQVDPPGRVARLNYMDGAVSFAPGPASGGTDTNAWEQAQTNRPLTGGDRLWTDQRARSELHIGSTALRMDEQTSLDFLALDDTTTQLRLSQGTVNFRVRALFDGQRFEIDTPNLAFAVSQPGEYRIDVNPANNTTRVVVLAGAGEVYGDNGVPFTLGNRQQSSFTGTQLAQVNLPGSQLADTFDAWAADRNRQEDQSVTARYIPREVPGYAQLDTYGDWSQDASYGPVWIPRTVPANWAPYRVGHWSWIAPWGWTWIDDAPWGFAPFHYGRWAQVGPRWAWVPGRIAPRPVYAPALVAFVGGGSGGVSWNISVGGGGPRPGLGWFPLAPGEAYRPAYRASPRYVTQVNNNIVINKTVNVTNVYRYQRTPGAVTAVSAADFAQGRPVRGNAAVSAADLGRAQVVNGGRGIPQRPDVREQPRPVAGALPPAAATARPVVNLGGNRGDRGDRRGPDGRPGNPDGRDGRGENRGNAVPAPVAAAQPAPGSNSAVRPGTPATNVPSNTPINATGPNGANNPGDPRGRRDADRPGGAPNAPNATPNANGPESIGQRALREAAARDQAQKNGTPVQTRPDTRPAADNSIEQAQRAQQQLQRDQQRQQREQTRQADQQRRQSEESIGQRALRDAAARDQQTQQNQQQQQQRQQAQAQQQQAAKQQAEARHQQDQQRHEQAQQNQQAQQQQQRAQREQAQAAQRSQQQAQQAQQAEARQARGDQMRQQQERPQQERPQQPQRREAPEKP
jgi:DNA segregation ATPase FtsK/SpoIIIE-like protein